MELTKFGHACVRLEKDGRRLVIDPGGLTDPGALEGADAVLVTHEHFDHFSEEILRRAAAERPNLRIWTNSSVAKRLDGIGTQVVTTGDGDAFSVAGFDIRVHGTWHAVIHPEIPRIPNIGFLVDESLLHPGDALTVPGTPISTLLLPVHAPWSTVGDVIDYVREVAPRDAYAVHDGALNDIGGAMVEGFLGEHGPGSPARYHRLPPGTSARIA
jgi:L-ascorbate metabolism protein UlaG (beta-lactamase superfamily)